MNHETHLHAVLRVFQPSILSTVCAVVLGTAMTLFLIVAPYYESSGIGQYLRSIDVQDSEAYQQYDSINSEINASKFAADTSVFAVWSVIGLIWYAIIMSVVQFVLNVRRFIIDIEFSREDRKRVAHDLFWRLVIRVAAACALYALYYVSTAHIVPSLLHLVYSISLQPVMQAVVTSVTIATVLVVCLHLLVVLARLTLLRERIFFTRYSDINLSR